VGAPGRACTIPGVWDLQPTLSGRVVRLEPLTLAHRDGLLAVAGDERIWEHWSFDPARSEADFDAWLERCLSEAAAGREGHFATVLQASGEPVGATSFCDPNEQDRGLEIGWTWLTPGAWGTGANTEAKFLQLRYAFEALGCIRVMFDTYARNARSRAALEKLGATFEGVLRNYSIRQADGSKVDSAFYSVIDDEWPAVRERLAARLAAL